ncbi:hypothetical protein [Terricaulis sp.]|uniref:hypothetical protein n=1 Tax=Terricaulis sp. TaxID=2768686 RepID=UPI002AC381DB|nr:hypothetical protein [Terricaulis sp.]MDZ4693418.1 hypothetical protein [Terricaulis sp.]
MPTKTPPPLRLREFEVRLWRIEARCNVNPNFRRDLTDHVRAHEAEAGHYIANNGRMTSANVRRALSGVWPEAEVVEYPQALTYEEWNRECSRLATEWRDDGVPLDMIRKRRWEFERRHPAFIEQRRKAELVPFADAVLLLRDFDRLLDQLRHEAPDYRYPAIEALVTAQPQWADEILAGPECVARMALRDFAAAAGIEVAQ